MISRAVEQQHMSYDARPFLRAATSQKRVMLKLIEIGSTGDLNPSPATVMHVHDKPSAWTCLCCVQVWCVRQQSSAKKNTK